MKPMKNMRAPLFVLVAVVGLAVVALFFFSGKSKDEKETITGQLPDNDFNASTQTLAPETITTDIPPIVSTIPSIGTDLSPATSATTVGSTPTVSPAPELTTV